MVPRLAQSDRLFILVVCLGYVLIGSLFAWLGFGFPLNILLLGGVPLIGLWVAGRQHLWGRFLVILLIALLLLLVVNCGIWLLLPWVNIDD